MYCIEAIVAYKRRQNHSCEPGVASFQLQLAKYCRPFNGALTVLVIL